MTKAKVKAQKANPQKKSLRMAIAKAKTMATDEIQPYTFPIKPPDLYPGVVKKGDKAPVMAMDDNPYAFAAGVFPGGGFPGYPYLSQLTTRPEYRAMASSLATEITREWIEFTSKQDDDSDSSDKIKAIEEEFKRLGVRDVIREAAENDCYFGRAQILIDIKGAKKNKPLILDPRTVEKGSLTSVVSVEAIWTTPSGYNTLDPAAPDYYKPAKWYMVGQEVHSSRLMTVITRPLPDMLKAAFNFGGISLSQLAEPYVDNWLRTRQSVSDLINNFSITVLATSMDQVLQGDDDGTDLFARADLFTATRSNKGIMLLDKGREELGQVNTPLSGLHELQAQAQEQQAAVARTPVVILTGISPSGLNASSDGEIRVFYDWISAQQEAYWRDPIETILKVVQLSLFGEIDPDIGFNFIPLYQMTPKEESEIRLDDANTADLYIQQGVIDNSEERERLAKDPNSRYHGLDTDMVIVPPNPEGEVPPDELVGGGSGEAEGELTTKDIALNGAQISSMVEVSQAVAAGTLAESAAIAILTTAFPLSDQEAQKFLAKPPKVVEEPKKGVGSFGQDSDVTYSDVCSVVLVPDKIDQEQFKKGLEIEKEHADTVDNDMETIAKIVLDHLEEDPEYYDKLAAAKL